MSLPLIVRPEAEQDAAEARDWYESRREGLGDEFLVELDATFSRIRQFPERYAAGYRGVRPALLHRFPYVVYYRLTGASIDVFAVMRGSRRSKAWRSRLN
jgi:plasmid stabilization system protein ParE